MDNDVVSLYDLVMRYDKDKKETQDKLDDAVEKLWELFEDIPMNPKTEETEQDFMEFPKGTSKYDIWHWFDERHSKGIHWLLYFPYQIEDD